MSAADWPAVSRIYELGLATGVASLLESTPSWEDWDQEHFPNQRWVARDEARVVGWAAVAVPHRTIPDGVGETSVYVDPLRTGQGIGSALLRHLVAASEQAGFWTLEARILQANAASCRLHVAHGFRLVGVRERIGVRQGQWCNVLLFERRSTLVGR
jgi:L-amino acid N-acyltransferase YncA